MKLKLICVAVSAALTHSTVVANETRTVEHLEVWGAKVKSSSIFIDDADISARQADHLSDLLRDIPGVDVGGSHSINQRINVRGLDDTDLEILIDGAAQNNYMFHHSGNLQINPDILKEVDIQVGNNSVVHTSLGGALEFRTKSANELLAPNQRFGGRVLAGYNTNDSHYLSLTAFGQLSDNLDILAYGNRVDRGNFEDGEGVEVIGTEGQIDNTMVKLGWDIDASQRLAIKIDQYRDEGDYPIRPDMGVRFNRDPETGEVPLLPTNYDRDTSSLHYELHKGKLIDLRADLFRNKSELSRVNNDVLTMGESVNTGLTLIANSTLGSDTKHQLTYGVKWINSEAENQRSGNPDSERMGTEENDNLGIFIEDRIELGHGFAITPGVRYNRHKKETSVIPQTQSWNDWQTALAGEYRITDFVTLTASTTELFKGPEQNEIFIDAAGNNLYNPNLQPETGHNNEVGIRYAANDAFGLDAIRLAFNYFDTTIENTIEEIYASADCQSRGCAQMQANVGEVELSGFESSVLVTQGQLDALVTFARSDANRVTDTEGSQPLNRDVGDSATFKLSYDLSQWDLAVSWRWQKTFSKTMASGFEKPAYDVHTLNAVWEPENLVEGLNVTLGIENLFDEIYVSHASRVGISSRFPDRPLNDYEPGRNIKLSVAYHF